MGLVSDPLDGAMGACKKQGISLFCHTAVRDLDSPEIHADNAPAVLVQSEQVSGPLGGHLDDSSWLRIHSVRSGVSTSEHDPATIPNKMKSSFPTSAARKPITNELQAKFHYLRMRRRLALFTVDSETTTSALS